MRPAQPLLIAGIAIALSASTPALSAPPDFERDVAPILKSRCHSCHGPEKQKSGFRLDVRARALAGGESGTPAIVPGKSAESELVIRVASADETEMMPPQESGDRLTDEQIAVLRQWIDAGAVWPDALAGEDSAKRGHWAFQTPKRPEAPAVRRSAWVRNEIDRFILARLEREGLDPAPEADKTTLLRRLSLDLIGLPPTPEEVDAFLLDNTPDAYAKAVDRLLASPRYGERWGRLWLDAARYADSDGFEKDKMRQVWFYRDWVISAFNRDLPYDRFITEQIAGDLLPNATQDQIVATGFLRNSMINEEGGVHPEQFRMEAMFDRMDALGKSVLGLTIQCAQCHSHKYDPITQEDYYRIFAYLNNDHEANVAVYTPAEQAKRAEIFRDIRAIEEDLRHRSPDWRDRMRSWEDEAARDQPEWTIVKPEVDDISTGGQKYLLQEDGSFLAQGYAPTKHTVKMTIKVDAPTIAAFRLELLNDPNLPLGGPGRSLKGTAALTEFRVEAAPANDPKKTQAVKIREATADVTPSETPLDSIFDDKSNKKRVTGPVAFAIDGKDETAWGTDIGPGRSNQPRKAVFVAETPIRGGKETGGTILTFFLTQNHGGWNSDDNQSHNLGRFRLAIADAPNAKADPLPAAVRAILAIPRDQRTQAQDEAVFSHWRTTVKDWAESNARIEALWKSHPQGDSQLVLNHRANPRMTQVLKRGDFLKPVRPVEPGVPSFLHPLPSEAPANRLGLAMWLTDRRSPTTARAIVNRIWQTYFGTGLSATSEDLGTQAEPPSHPELLDWLAVELMDQGWSLKRLHRAIAMSATYRQSSKVRPELAARDPYNRLLARGPRFRVEGEVVRDIALAASGLLNPQVGGPSSFPTLPGFLMQPPVSYGPKVWRESAGADRYRRGVYIFRYRSVPYPPLQTFDVPNGDASCVRRARSNTPLQALVTLNEPTFVECARNLAAKTLKEGGKTDAERLEYAFRRCLARKPEASESQVLLALCEKQRRRNREAKTEDAELAAWTIVARALLNLDETITKE